MPEYVYRNNTTGEERSIFQGMRDEHPEAVSFRPDGGWDVAVANDPLAWNRVYGNTLIDTKPCTGKYPLASMCLPKGLPGEKTDRNGYTVIKSRRHETELCKKHGYERVES